MNTFTLLILCVGLFVLVVDGQECEGRRCRRDDQCCRKYRCDESTRRCVRREDCRQEGQDCRREKCCENLRCDERNRRCVRDGDGGDCRKEGQDCSRTRDCCRGLKCGDQDRCVPGNCGWLGARCQRDEQCCSLLRCDPRQNRCA